MNSSHPALSREEIRSLADRLYEELVRPILTRGDAEEFAAIDVRSGEFELNEDDITAIDRLHGRVPEPQVFLMRVGRRPAYQIAGAR